MMPRSRLPKLSETKHAELAAETGKQWPPLYRLPSRAERHREQAQTFQQTGEQT